MGREELTEMHRAMLARFIIEETLRQEHGLEGVDYPEHLTKLEQILGIDAEVAHDMYHEMEEELWEHSWHAYTEEWAWHRASQDADKILSKKSIENKSREELMEELYDKNFDHYTVEIDMRDGSQVRNKKQEVGKRNRRK